MWGFKDGELLSSAWGFSVAVWARSGSSGAEPAVTQGSCLLAFS